MPAGTGTINLAQNITFNSLPQFGASAGIPINFSPGLATQLTGGSGAKQYNNTFAVTATTAGVTPIVYNLTATLIQPDGTTATFNDLVLVCISCPSTNTDCLLFGAGTDPVAEFTNAIKIWPGMTLEIYISTATGLAVTTTTADRITLTANSAVNLTFSLLLAGH